MMHIQCALLYILHRIWQRPYRVMYVSPGHRWRTQGHVRRPGSRAQLCRRCGEHARGPPARRARRARRAPPRPPRRRRRNRKSRASRLSERVAVALVFAPLDARTRLVHLRRGRHHCHHQPSQRPEPLIGDPAHHGHRVISPLH